MGHELLERNGRSPHRHSFQKKTAIFASSASFASVKEEIIDDK
jgi:hypothetical protein